MVVSSAIAKYNADVEKYFIINGAVAMECYNSSQDKESGMIHSDWDDYYFGQTNDFLFASEWYTLFNNNDARHDLSWRGIFTNMSNTTVYNMYSSGENVLGNIGYDQGNLTHLSGYTWGCQEKLKGRMFEASDWLVGSAVCGWGFNQYNYGAYTNSSGVTGITWYAESPSVAENINPTNLITKPFFLKSYPDLFSTNLATAKSYAANNNKSLLAKAIPARSFAVGRNDVDINNSVVQVNVNMNTDHQEENVWPLSRLQGSSEDNWLHSDIKDIGYIYNYKAYDYIVEKGGLK
jgi:hypothetical protein